MIEQLPSNLEASADPPTLFDGTTRLYVSYVCPYAQRTWITRNYKGLQEKIKLVPINLQNRPIWYKEKVYPGNKDPTKQEFATELLSYSDTLNKVNFSAITSKGDARDEIGAAYDKLEEALAKFDGPFFLGEFSLVDIAYAPFVVERFKPLFSKIKNYNITKGRPKLTKWIEELNKIDAYTATKRDPREILSGIKKRFGIE